ncbi:MAG: N-carbamoylputrescine amidase [Actinomycetes bacterium]|jgi:N-carbamoylputrescine amidase|nr:N-carbamoylputrescine amidase [Actinomycetes bacterium]
MRKVTVAATQMRSRGGGDANRDAAEALVRAAAEQGAQIILLQELFENNYFCQKQKPEYYALADTVEENQAIQRFSAIAAELGVVLPISFYEMRNRAHYNSLAVIDADGTLCGVYRKSHIPDGAGYSEKYYFSPGDTGFQVFDTAYGRIGCAVCWDQWFPEAARIMALRGAELLLYPTAIGDEPLNPALDSRDHWQTVMRGHAAANLVPVVASNRTGTEVEDDWQITFYGSSFIADEHGAVVAVADRESECVLTATFDLDAIDATRNAWGVFRDRRPDLYRELLSLDGETAE